MSYYISSSYISSCKIGQSFGAIAWPVISPLIGGGDYLSNEVSPEIERAYPNAISLKLDQEAGIDALQRLPSGALVSLAHRVQFGPTSWDTFTIRLNRTTGAITEFEKRLTAIRTPKAIFPSWTLTAYALPSGELLSCAAIQTEALYLMTARELESGSSRVIKKRVNRYDGNEFYAIDWDLTSVAPLYPELDLRVSIWRG